MDRDQRHILLTLARETIQAKLADEPLPPLPTDDIKISDFGGVFVTLKNKGRLRGCIGQFLPKAGLLDTVQKMALAALDDPRFLKHPVTEEELPEINIEISVLSPMDRTCDPLSLEPGVHGIYIRKGFQSGVFLPQVATEQKWDKEEFLSRCCSGKASLSADAWKDPDTEVYLFTAEVFGEND